MNCADMSRETFSELLAACLPSVRKMVQSRLRAWDQAEDVLQQTLLQAFKHRDQLQAHSKFKSWLWSIATNEIYMFHRRLRLHVPLQDSVAMNYRDEAQSPLDRVERIERVSRVRTAMGMLSERDRTTLRLRDFEGLSLAETAEAMRSSQSAAKSAQFRARQRLKMALCTSGGVASPF